MGDLVEGMDENELVLGRGIFRQVVVGRGIFLAKVAVGLVLGREIFPTGVVVVGAGIFYTVP